MVDRPDVKLEQLVKFAKTSRNLFRVGYFKTGLWGILQEDPGENRRSVDSTRATNSYQLLELCSFI